MKRLGLVLLVVALVGLLAGCGQIPVNTGTTPPPQTEDPSVATKGVFTDPGKYLGQEVKIEGVLEAEGRGRDVRFFLRGSGTERLEVTAWAPLEVMQPPAGGGPAPKAMSNYLGQNLRLAGVVEKQTAGYILRVGSAEVLP